MGVDYLDVWSLSLGCPKNRVDTEHLLGSLNINIRSCDNITKADLVLINTCAFIESAVRESLRAILEVLDSLKKLKTKPYVVVLGCLIGRYGESQLKSEFPEVDLFLASQTQELWPSQLAEGLKLNHPKVGRILSTGPSYAWLKIGEGCRHHCSFCTIPSIRGDQRSLDPKFLQKEAQDLLDQGVKELICVAQDVCAWGQDLNLSLTYLLEKLLALPKIFWLRLMYLYPAGLSDELLSFMQKAQFPLLPYFDIPIQHSHPEILTMMGRPFAKDPRYILDKVRKYLPDAVFRTSLIVGFPGEKEEHFRHLYDFVAEAQFMHLGVFVYEREEGTLAYDFKDQVPREEANLRREELLSLQKDLSAERLERYVGQNMEVLVDSSNPEWPGLYNGRVWFQAPEVDGQTYISGEHVKSGQVVRAEIVESQSYDLTALE